MALSQRSMRILVWTFFNLFLVVAIFFVLDFYNVWPISDYYKTLVYKETAMLPRASNAEEALLLKEAELVKLNNSLLAKEQLVFVREKSLQAMQEQIDNIMLKLRIKTEQLRERELKLIAKDKKTESTVSKVKEQADKIENMPPAQAVSILEGLPTLEVIEIFRQMDRSAEDAGRNSIVSYLISLISAPALGEVGGIEGGRGNIKKAQEILRLMGKYSK